MNKDNFHRWNAADTVTALRIVFSLFLPFLPLYSFWFFFVYTLTGLTDVLDGFIARKTGTAGSFGAKLDSIADLVFYSIMLVRFLPTLWQALPRAIWYAVAAVLAVRLAAYLTAAVKYHRFASLHTWLNKVTGAAVFLLPFALAVHWEVPYCIMVCALGLIASAEELWIHLFQKEYDENRKSVFFAESKQTKDSTKRREKV